MRMWRVMHNRTSDGSRAVLYFYYYSKLHMYFVCNLQAVSYSVKDKLNGTFSYTHIFSYEYGKVSVSNIICSELHATIPCVYLYQSIGNTLRNGHTEIYLYLKNASIPSHNSWICLGLFIQCFALATGANVIIFCTLLDCKAARLRLLWVILSTGYWKLSAGQQWCQKASLKSSYLVLGLESARSLFVSSFVARQPWVVLHVNGFWASRIRC